MADPGEIVWTWVPFEEDHRQGKDRPVLVIGHDGPWLLALPLTSKDHRSDPAAHPQPRSQWTQIGSTGYSESTPRESAARERSWTNAASTRPPPQSAAPADTQRSRTGRSTHDLRHPDLWVAQ
jgi:PemK-like, MazF-like toxin of type II toxin-antitoxin system